MRARVWQSLPDSFTVGIGCSPRRASARFGSVPCIDMGVPYAWGLQAATGPTLPSRADLDEAVRWCAERAGGRQWVVSVPEALVDVELWRDFAAYDRMDVYALPAGSAGELVASRPAELRLEVRPSYDRVVAAYGGWMDDDDLARLLVVPGDLDLAERAFVVGMVGDVAVGCAFVWWFGGTAHLSGIGVREHLRGRGYGAALTVAATRHALRAAPHGAPDLVWMRATPDGAGLYERLGFVRVDTEVQLLASR